MKVKIQNRSVYHKFAEVEIEVDKDEFEHYKLEHGKYTTLLDFLQDRCFLYDTKIDEAMSKAEYVHGTGLYDFKGMDEAESDSEWRYDCPQLKTGGHL
jgi:hypothetical protein|tara:strand:+ start:83 stop:376 length:294 start_codon:yes stop_codon:yes gene_type:complete